MAIEPLALPWVIVEEEAFLLAAPSVADPDCPVWAQTRLWTPRCRTYADLCHHLGRARQHLAASAERDGGLVAPLASAPCGRTSQTAPPRERGAVTIGGADRGLGGDVFNGMVVIVHVPGRDAGVRVLNRLRPWLHVLVALSANSPLVHGVDTGFASWRSANVGA